MLRIAVIMFVQRYFVLSGLGQYRRHARPVSCNNRALGNGDVQGHSMCESAIDPFPSVMPSRHVHLAQPITMSPQV